MWHKTDTIRCLKNGNNWQKSDLLALLPPSELSKNEDEIGSSLHPTITYCPAILFAASPKLMLIANFPVDNCIGWLSYQSSSLRVKFKFAISSMCLYVCFLYQLPTFPYLIHVCRNTILNITHCSHHRNKLFPVVSVQNCMTRYA